MDVIIYPVTFWFEPFGSLDKRASICCCLGRRWQSWNSQGARPEQLLILRDRLLEQHRDTQHWQGIAAGEEKADTDSRDYTTYTHSWVWLYCDLAHALLRRD